MGKPYIIELRQLEDTYTSVMEMDVSSLSAFVSAASMHPLYTVGSGGSLSAAHLVSYLHQRWANQCAKAITPLEAVSFPVSKQACFWFFSAGGRNADINDAFREVVTKEPRQLCIMCAKTRSPLARYAEGYSYTEIFDFDLHSKRDGFLATNSLLAFAILAFRAYKSVFVSEGSNPEHPSFRDIIRYSGSTESFLNNLRHLCAPILKRDTLVVLYGPATQPAAFDLESKFAEASLGHVLLADYRNFAHGRHHWLAKRGDKSAVLAFSTDQEKKNVTNTIALLPEDVPVVHMDFSEQGIYAPVAAMATVLYIVALAGEALSIDPGRPGVPAFGRKIYHLRGLRSFRNQDSDILIHRKVQPGLLMFSEQYMRNLNEKVKKFTKEIQKKTFSAVVFDYDGTLCSQKNRFIGIDSGIVRELNRLLHAGIPLGIATGRGKSVSSALRQVISNEFFSRIIIGYYNGAECGYLSDYFLPNGTDRLCPELDKIREVLNEYSDLQYISKITNRKYQITVEAKQLSHLQSIWEIVNAILHRYGSSRMKVFLSSHSVDILAPSVTKTRVIDMILQQFKPKNELLCIGDMGAWPGNDYELLSMPFSLSVDQVSPDSESCWNIAPAGYRGVQATLYYLKCMNAQNGEVRLKMRHSMRANKL